MDAKILNRHEPALPKVAFVGYFVEGTGEHQERRVASTESDDAEIEAILFAIESLESRFRRFTVISDHQSVVSEANREKVKKPSELLARLRDTLKEKSPSIRLEPLKFNPAHQTLTEFVNRQKESAAIS